MSAPEGFLSTRQILNKFIDDCELAVPIDNVSYIQAMQYKTEDVEGARIAILGNHYLMTLARIKREPEEGADD